MKKKIIIAVVAVIATMAVGRGLFVAYDFFTEMQQIEDRACFINEEVHDI